MAVLVGLAVPVLVGLTAFAVDISKWSATKNSLQGAADNAVLSAVMAGAQSGATLTQIKNQAYAVAAAAGYANGQNGVTVTVNNPPASGPNAANTSAYEVIIKQPQTRYFAVLLGAAPTVSGRAVALVAANPPCFLALDPVASSDIGANGSFNINAPKCTVAANSSSSSAMNFNGAGTLTASNLNVVGNYTTNGAITINAKIKTGAQATPDPYASLAVPPVGPCDQINYSKNGAGTYTISQGVYCGGITLNGSSTLNMNPGVYIINGGGFNLNGSSTVTGSGVSIVLTNTPSHPGTSTWGNIQINGSTTVTLTPPTSGAMQGVVVYVDRNAPQSGTDLFNGASSMAITGSIYVPSQTVTWNGASSTGGACLQLIARKITVNGAASLGTNCGTLVVPGLQQTYGPNGKGVPAE